MHKDCADRRGEGHDRGRQTQPCYAPADRQRLLHPCNTFFKRLADRPCVDAGGFLEQAVTPCFFELPVARRSGSAVQAFSPARTRRFDSCQVQLETRSTISAVGQHFVQGAPFAIPTAPGADLSDRLRARVPSEVVTETFLCRCSYGQAVQSGIKLPLRNFEPVSTHQTLIGRFNRAEKRGARRIRGSDAMVCQAAGMQQPDK